MSEKEMEHMNSIYKKLKTIKFEIIIVSIALFVLGLLLVIFPTASQEIICKGIVAAINVFQCFFLICDRIGIFVCARLKHPHLDAVKKYTHLHADFRLLDLYCSV